MSVTAKFAQDQADAAAQAAVLATLDNVRDRELRSEAAWRAMAAQASKTEESRRRREEGRADSEDAATTNVGGTA